MIKKLLYFSLIFLSFSGLNAQTIDPIYQDGKLYVKLSQNLSKSISRENPTNIPLTKLASLQGLFSNYGVSKVYKPFYQADDDANLSSILKIEFSQIDKIEALIEELQRVAGIDYAEKVRINKTDVIPNDPLFATSSGSTHLNQINAQNAWNVFSGNSNITVAIVDNAVMWTHADLVGNTYTNTVEANGTSGVDDDGNGYIDDINGYDVADMDGVTNPTNTAQDHGTHCAGIAGANNNNSIGIASIGWNVKVIPVKASYDNSSPGFVALGYEGIIYAVKAKAKIISCSWGNLGLSSLTEQYVIDYAWNRGCIIFASAGNAGNSTLNYPGAYNHVYCVAWVDATDTKASLSNYGTYVDISAPGSNILSTLPYTSSTASYNTMSGTSMATPMVAGLAGLMLSKSPNMTRTDVLNCISNSAVNIYTLTGNTSYASNSALGAGRIDAFAAMNCAATYSALPPVANFFATLPNTCPNTAIPFTDSSLYNPTSWSWTFQGGSPATSTSSNPSVSWSIAGTYSVSLTVSNANGSNTKTKTAYITVAGPTPLPFQEGFENAAFLPANWVKNNIWNDNIYWERKTGVGGFGTSTVCAMFNNFVYNAPGEKDEMRSPKFDFTNVGSARLRFDVSYARYDAYYSDTLEVMMSTDCGTSWTEIYRKGGSSLSVLSSDYTSQFIPTSTQWRRDTIDISTATAGQGSVMFAFLNKGAYGQAIYLDNINLVFPTPTLSAVSNASICVNPSYTFSNSSVGAINYTWTFQGGSPATSTVGTPTVTYATPGTYTLSLSGVNNTLTSTLVKTITVLANPVIATTSSVYCSGSTYTLNGNGATSYTWSSSNGPDLTGSNFVFTPTVNSTYTLTGSNGVCASSGIYTVSVVSGVTLSANNQTICSGSTATLTASGATTYSWNTAATTSSITVNPATTTNYVVSGTSGNCVNSKTVSVIVRANPSTTVTSVNPSCFNTCDGSISAATNGSSGPYTYVLSGSMGCTNFPCSNICAGVYTVYTMDSYSCSSQAPLSIVPPLAIQSILSVTHAACMACADGALMAGVNGGTPPYTYNWSPSGGTNALAQNLTPGCYTLTITDNNNCSSKESSCVDFLAGISKQSLSSLHIYPNPASAEVKIELNAGQFNLAVYNAIGQLIISKTNNQNFYAIDLSNFAKGIYFIEIESGSEVARKKLVVE
ncbi:hypothetical protein CNR22_17015 [Sphingobacteriaceae bacterium]|nr:hypothetical protein CNR22_17015 [Sphingobacteriaceae bacterium]